RLDVTRQRVLVVQQVDLVNCHACGNRTNADLERRDAERLADLFVRVAKLLDKLGVSGLEGERRELQVCADDGHAATIVAGEPRVEELLKLVCGFFRNGGRGGQNAARIRRILEERRAVPQDAD